MVEYLDAKYPAFKQGNGPYLDAGQRAVVGALLSMIEAIPQHLIVLEGKDLVEYMEAVCAVRAAVEAWRGGTSGYLLKEPPAASSIHPLLLLRKHLTALPDEGISGDTTDLPFVKDAEFRDALRRDISSANQALANGEWKAATVLAGSVVEALLLYALEAADPATVKRAIDRVSSQKATLAKRLRKAKNRWSLFELTAVASHLDMILSDTEQQCEISRRFRDLIHPGRSKRLKQVCSRGTALSAVAAVEHVVADLTKVLA